MYAPPKPAGNFYELICAELMTVAGKQAQVLQRVTVLHLLCIWNIRKVTRGGKKAGWVDDRTVNEGLCSLEGGYAYFKGCVNLDAQKHGTGLA